MKQPLLDYGTPEEEAMRWRVLPWYIRYQRINDTYPFTVKYYDKPEGEDLFGKLIAANRYTVGYGFMWGIVDATMLTRKTGVQARIGRVIHFTWPAAACATVFTSVVYFATKIRRKDDIWNYELGAIAAGSVIGGWQRYHVMGWSAALAFGIMAAVQRIRINEGWVWWNYKEQEPGDHRSHKHQWNLFSERPKGYTTSHEE